MQLLALPKLPRIKPPSSPCIACQHAANGAIHAAIAAFFHTAVWPQRSVIPAIFETAAPLSSARRRRRVSLRGSEALGPQLHHCGHMCATVDLPNTLPALFPPAVLNAVADLRLQGPETWATRSIGGPYGSIRPLFSTTLQPLTRCTAQTTPITPSVMLQQAASQAATPAFCPHADKPLRRSTLDSV